MKHHGYTYHTHYNVHVTVFNAYGRYESRLLYANLLKELLKHFYFLPCVRHSLMQGSSNIMAYDVFHAFGVEVSYMYVIQIPTTNFEPLLASPLYTLFCKYAQEQCPY